VSERKRILLVKPVLPWPPDQGTRVVSAAIIEALSSASDVTVLARILDSSEMTAVAELEKRCARVVTVFPANRKSAAARVAFRAAYWLRSWFTGRSMKSLYDCPGAFVRAARELSREKFDLVIVEYWQLYPLLDVFDRDRTVLVTHDIDIIVNAQRAVIEDNLFAKAAALRRWRTERGEETRAYRSARHVWALTARDAAAVTKLSGGTGAVAVLPFGLPETQFVPDAGPRASREILFLGAMGAAFNRDALAHFANDIHPLLASIEGISFTVVGGELPASLAFFGAFRDVEVAGHARDVSAFLARCACMVVPLRYGGGLRIRILEAMAAGVPVVASPVAIEGMILEPGKHLLVAATPAEYRAHVERLLSDPAVGHALAREAQAHVHRTYGPAARLEGLRHLAESRMARPGEMSHP
jgi:glycosyltransferase involved in cell wall biosynthesis